MSGFDYDHVKRDISEAERLLYRVHTLIVCNFFIEEYLWQHWRMLGLTRSLELVMLIRQTQHEYRTIMQTVDEIQAHIRTHLTEASHGA